VEPNLAILTYLARELAEPKDAPQAARLNHSSLGILEHDLWRHIVQPSLVILTCVRPRPPELVIVHELGWLPIHRFPIRAADHVGIQHPALDGEAPFGEVLPGMPSFDRGPADAELLQTGTQRQKHPGMITDAGLRCAPRRDRLAADLDYTGEILAIEAPGSHEGPTVAVEQENPIEPVPRDLG
jgi:hypothetical protein